MALVVKHTFLEYRPAIARSSDDSAEEESFHYDDELEFSSRRRSRAFSDSEIKYGKSDGLYSSPESCETDSTCLETSSLSDVIGSSSSAASSAGGDSRETAQEIPNSPELGYREVPTPSWDFAASMSEASWQGSDEQEEQRVKARVMELNREASELMAKALKAEEAAQQLRQKLGQNASAPWCQTSGDASSPIQMPVQMMQWVPVSYFAMPDTIQKEFTHENASCQPKQRQQNKGKPNAARAVRTTLMLRNIPNNYSRDMLLELLDREGFKACYDFVYLPVDFHRLAGLGYVFVNFATTESAQRAKQHFQGFDRWAVTSHKVCDVSWGEPLQGLDAHIDRYRNSPVMHEDVPEQYKPVYLQSGVRQPFPVPSKRIRPPRIKRGGIPGMLPDFSALANAA
jgi:hypothetical protein